VSQLRTVAEIVDRLVERVDSDALIDMATEDIVAAVELHFDPVRLRELPVLANNMGDQCSTDGYYEAELDPRRPWIIYASASSDRRTRFTVVHEVGHHLLFNDACDLLEDIDRLGERHGGAQRVEERVCHGFAGRVLVPLSTVEGVLNGATRLTPEHIEAIYAESNASYEACSIRAVEAIQVPAAVVLLRERGVVGFSTASSRMQGGWWPRGQRVQPGGALDRCFDGDRRARKDQYRFGMSFEAQLFCDTKVVREGALAIAVMSETRSDGQWDLLDPGEPAWQTAERFCPFDGDEMDFGWCDQCSGRRCRSCNRCACDQPQPMALCPGCGFPEPANPGHKFCRTCVLDGRED